MEDHTFIRMPWAQLMGDPEAPRLPVNEPVLAGDTMTLARYRDTRSGPSRTGVDSYVTTPDQAVPGAAFDLKLLDGALDDVLDHHATGKGRSPVIEHTGPNVSATSAALNNSPASGTRSGHGPTVRQRVLGAGSCRARSPRFPIDTCR